VFSDGLDGYAWGNAISFDGEAVGAREQLRCTSDGEGHGRP